MSYKEKTREQENQCFNGRVDAKRQYHSIINNREIDSSVICDLWKDRQEKSKYTALLRVDYYFWKRVRSYWESYVAEYDRLILNAVGSLSTKEAVLSLQGWC